MSNSHFPVKKSKKSPSPPPPKKPPESCFYVKRVSPILWTITGELQLLGLAQDTQQERKQMVKHYKSVDETGSSF